MKVEYVDPFVRAAYTVLQTITGETPTRGELSVKNSPFTTQQITILAGVNGQIEGAALYGMSLETAEQIASAMIGMQVEKLDEMAWSALSELGNMVTGNAATLLSQTGLVVDITPPSMIKGINTEISTRTPALVVPINTKFGWIEINVALQESNMKKAA